MTMKNYTHLLFILDRSGSMLRSASDVEGGFWKLIEDQRKQAGKVTVGIAMFNGTVSFREPLNIADVRPIALNPGGSTALHDAIGHSVRTTGQWLHDMPEAERPDNVVVTIMTDGEENASTRYTSESVAAIIKEQEEKYNWKFAFVGADRGAVECARDLLGIHTTAVYSVGAERKTFGALSNSVSRTRVGEAYTLTPEELKSMVK